jgi:hypothetical protein
MMTSAKTSLQTSLQRNTFREEEDLIGTFRQANDNDSISMTNTINSDSMSIESYVSRISALENLLSTHNIALPANISTSSSEAPSKAREGGHN